MNKTGGINQLSGNTMEGARQLAQGIQDKPCVHNKPEYIPDRTLTKYP